MRARVHAWMASKALITDGGLVNRVSRFGFQYKWAGYFSFFYATAVDMMHLAAG